jgi:hypothetical protein
MDVFTACLWGMYPFPCLGTLDFQNCLRSHTQLYSVYDQPDQATHQGTVDADKLQVPAYGQFDPAAGIFAIP